MIQLIKQQQGQQQQQPKKKETMKVMRKAVRKWRNEQIEKTPYCYVTGSQEALEVHHATSFSQIFRMAHKNLNIQYHKYIDEYNDEDVKQLKAEIIRLHNKIDAVVLAHDIHLLLHQTYGTEVDIDTIDNFKKNF